MAASSSRETKELIRAFLVTLAALHVAVLMCCSSVGESDVHTESANNKTVSEGVLVNCDLSRFFECWDYSTVYL